jgi:GNAT superfamily N-acetyltransferase
MGVSVGEVVETLDERLIAAGLFEKLQCWDVNAREQVGDAKVVILDQMKLHREYRRLGYGHRILAVFTAYCDEQGLDAELTARPLPDGDVGDNAEDEQVSIERLFRLYEAHGFVRTGAGNQMLRASRPMSDT